MKVLWFSNCRLIEKPVSSSGTWLYTMANCLIDNDIDLINITEGSVSQIIEENYKSIRQFVLPPYRLTKKGVPNKKKILKIVSIVESISPDIIHIWGMEKYWGLLATRGYIKGRFLLDIQGIRQSCGEVFEGGLSLPELLRSFRLKELLRPSLSIIGLKQRHLKWGEHEREMLSFFQNISTQSEWVRNRIYPFLNAESHVFETKICVRNAFLECPEWDIKETKDGSLFTITTSASSLRGIHIIIKALTLIKVKRPNVHLYIAGDFEQKKSVWRKSGYVKYLEWIIKQYNLQSSITFLGRLDEVQMVSWLRKCQVFVQSSFVESYSLALAEALCVGTPCVVAYSGAMPEISGYVCDYYSPYDYVVCASLISKLLDTKEALIQMSKNELELEGIRITGSQLAQVQISIYNKISNDAEINTF